MYELLPATASSSAVRTTVSPANKGSTSAKGPAPKNRAVYSAAAVEIISDVAARPGPNASHHLRRHTPLSRLLGQRPRPSVRM